MTIVQKDQVEIAVDRPSYKLKDKENFIALITMLVSQLQEIEEALILLGNQKDIDNVVGIYLDYLGKILGEDRLERSDEEYRTALKLKISINNSDGTPDIISEIIQTYTNADSIRLAEARWAWGQVILTSPEQMSDATFKLLEDIRPVATKIFLLYDLYNRAFCPAWELQIGIVELFEVFTGFVTEGLELVLDDLGNTSLLYVNETGNTTQYLEGTTGRQWLEWEEPELLEVFDGNTVTNLIVNTNGSLEELVLGGISSSPTGEIQLYWECDYTHTLTVIRDEGLSDMLLYNDLYDLLSSDYINIANSVVE